MNSYELLEQYASELEIDTQVDITNIMQKQLSAPNIKHKWLYRRTMAKKELIRLVEFKESIISKLFENHNLPISNATARKNFQKDSNVQKIEKNIRDQELLVEYLDDAVKQLNNIGFDYKNIVELIKLEQL